MEKLKIAVRARRENGIPIEVKKGSGSITLFDYPSITASSKQFTLDSKVRARSIFNARSVTKTTGSIKDCFKALGHDAAIFDEEPCPNFTLIDGLVRRTGIEFLIVCFH